MILFGLSWKVEYKMFFLLVFASVIAMGFWGLMQTFLGFRHSKHLIKASSRQFSFYSPTNLTRIVNKIC